MNTLQKIKTSHRMVSGLNDIFISEKLKDKIFSDSIKKINNLGTYPHNSFVLGNEPNTQEIRLKAPPKFIYFYENNYIFFTSSNYIGKDFTNRYNNYISHTIAFKKTSSDYFPINFIDSSLFLNHIDNELKKFIPKAIDESVFFQDLKKNNLSNEINTKNELICQAFNLLICSKINSTPLFIVGDSKENSKLLRNILNMLPPKLSKIVSFSTLCFHNIKNRENLLDINCYSDYSFGLDYISTYKTKKDLIKDIEAFQYDFIDIENFASKNAQKNSEIINFLLKSNIQEFVYFSDSFNISFANIISIAKAFKYIKQKTYIPTQDVLEISELYVNFSKHKNDIKDFIHIHINPSIIIKDDINIFLKYYNIISDFTTKNDSDLYYVYQNAISQVLLSALKISNKTFLDVYKEYKENIDKKIFLQFFISNYQEFSLILKKLNIDSLEILDTLLLKTAYKYRISLPKEYFINVSIVLFKNDFKNTMDTLEKKYSANKNYILEHFDSLISDKTILDIFIADKNIDQVINLLIENQMHALKERICLCKINKTNNTDLLKTKSQKYKVFLNFFEKYDLKNSTFIEKVISYSKNDLIMLNDLFNNEEIVKKNKELLYKCIDVKLNSNYDINKKYIKFPNFYENNKDFESLSKLFLERHPNLSAEKNNINKSNNHEKNTIFTKIKILIGRFFRNG